MERKFTDNEIVKALDICDKLNFFYGQRAGYELWFVKPVEVQDRDVKQFAEDMQFVKSVINRQKAEIERLTDMIHRQSDVVEEQREAIEKLYPYKLHLRNYIPNNLVKEMTEGKT